MLTRYQIQGRLESFLRQIFQSSCALCERPAQDELCSFCYRQLLQEHIELSSPSKPFFWGNYQGVLKRAIAKLKYDQRPRLGNLLGEELGLACARNDVFPSSVRVVAIPLHCDRLKQRQYNQSEIIAKKFASVLGVQYCPNGLIRHRSTPALHSLAPQERESNLDNAFSLGSLSQCNRKVPIVLVDDIYTTGATMREAKRILRHHRFQIVGEVVVAKAISFSNRT